jgi:nucleoid-associated protein YgaU
MRAPLIALLALAAATPASAQSTDAAATQPQAGAEEAASGSAARVAEALDRMEAFFAEDRAAAATGTPVSLEVEQALRDSLQALVAAGEAEGMDGAKIERLLAYHATRRFGRSVPDLLKGPDGRLDVRTLLVGTGAMAPAPVRDAERDYLSAIAAEGTTTNVRGAEVSPVASPTPAQAADTPATPASRIVTRDGRDWLTVVPGDTLTAIAAEVYGDVLGYRRIYVANREVLVNPNLLTPGIVLEIPR